MNIRASIAAVVCTAAVTLTPAGTLAYPAPPPDPTLPKSEVPVALQQLRRDLLDPALSALAFRNLDEIFTVRTVPRSGSVWQIPRSDHELDFKYTFQGKEYSAQDVFDRTYTNALLIIKDGRIVSETYRNNTHDSTRFIAWSATKSVIALLVGIAVHEGRIKSIDDQVTQYLSELKGSGYDGATVRHILQMRSGVDYEERYDFGNPGIAARNHETALVQNVVRFADAARTIKRKDPPGKVFQYKTLDTAVLGWLLERVSGGSNLSAYMAQRLWEPLGAERDGFFMMDGAPGMGREFSGAGFNASLRDLARIGLMMLNEGKANGRQIVPQAWIREATRPVGDGQTPYGYQIWLVPDSLAYMAVGLQGQFIYVDPDTRTVIAKVSYFPPGETTADQETAAFFAAASRWQPR